MRRTLIALGLVAAMFLSTSCERRGGGTAGGDPIKVGVYLDLSGQTSSFGQSTKNGIEMARDEINKAGGINGRPIELVIEDEQGRKEGAINVFKKLIFQDKVLMLFGPTLSNSAQASAVSMPSACRACALKNSPRLFASSECCITPSPAVTTNSAI